MDVFTEESFDKVIDQKQWDHIELAIDSQAVSTKVYPFPQVNRSNLTSSSMRLPKVGTYAH